MKTRLAVLLAVGAGVSSALAATWSTNYNEVGGIANTGAVAVTALAPDGRILLAGPADESARVLVVDADGNPLWSVAFPDPAARMGPSAATFTADGGAVVVSFIGFGPDSVMMKFDAAGNVVWQRLLPANGGPTPQILNAIVEAPNGDLVGAGAYQFRNQGQEAWVVRFNASGDIVWSRAFADPHSGAQFEDVVLIGDDAIVVGFGNSQQNPGLDALALRIDPTGKILWQTRMGSVDEDTAHAVTRLAGGDFALTGARWASSSIDTCVPYLARFDGAGNVIWQESVTNVSSGVCFLPTGAAPSADGGFAVAGLENIQATLHAVSDTGAPIYKRVYGYVRGFEDLRATPDGGYVAGGGGPINAETMGPDGLVGGACPTVTPAVPTVSSAGLSAKRGAAKNAKAPQTSIPTSIAVRPATFLRSDVCLGPVAP